MFSMNVERKCCEEMKSGTEPESPRPRVSFAIPVRNGERFLGRALESILAQDFEDLEIVVCDNASTDGTGDIVRRYAEHDRRVRYVRNPEDIGQIENFNRAFELSRGDFIRWMGADDWIERDYARKCVAALEARPDAVGVTTQWRFMDDAGQIEFLDVPGPRVDALTPSRRLHLTLRLLQSNQLLFDPIYSLVRRETLARTGLLPINRWTDRLLAVELCLLGPFCHLDECLSTRRNAREPRKVRQPRYHQCHEGWQHTHRWMLYAEYADIVRRGPISKRQKLPCWLWIFFYWLWDEGTRWTRRIIRVLTPRGAGA